MTPPRWKRPSRRSKNSVSYSDSNRGAFPIVKKLVLGAVLLPVLILGIAGCGGSQEADNRYNAAVVLHDEERLEEAIKEYAAALQVDSQHPDAYYGRGRAYSGLLQHQQAVRDFDEAIRLQPERGEIYRDRGKAYYGLGGYEQAIRDFDEALRLVPQDANTQHSRGLAYFSLGQYARSLEDFDEAIRLDPKLSDAYTRRVMVFTMLGQDPEAQQAVDRAVEVGVDRAFLEQYIKSLKMVR